MNVQLRTQALIELKSLKLLQFQKQLRHEVLNTVKVCVFFLLYFDVESFLFLNNRKIH